MFAGTPDLPWVMCVSAWESLRHRGPSDRFPMSTGEIKNEIVWCRRCAKRLFRLGSATNAALRVCAPEPSALR